MRVSVRVLGGGGIPVAMTQISARVSKQRNDCFVMQSGNPTCQACDFRQRHSLLQARWFNRFISRRTALHLTLFLTVERTHL